MKKKFNFTLLFLNNLEIHSVCMANLLSEMSKSEFKENYWNTNTILNSYNRNEKKKVNFTLLSLNNLEINSVCTANLLSEMSKSDAKWLLPSRIFCSMGPADRPPDSQRYLRMYFVVSVFPAPDSPETTIDWDCFKTFMSRKALSTVKFPMVDG